MLKKTVFALVSALLMPVEGFAQQDCASVYQNAVRNFSLDEHNESSNAYYFNLYCEKNGETRDFDFDGGLSIPIEGIPFDFSAAASNDSQRMQEFCRVGSERNGFASSSTAVRDIVVADALKSFNQCRQIESNGLVLTHQEAEPESVIIYGRFSTAGVNASLDTVTYDSNKMTCISNNLNDDMTQIVLDGTQGFDLTGRNFSISCSRSSEPQAGQEYYERATLQLSTNFGPYTVVLDSNAAMGFELANQAKRMFEEVVAEKTQIQSSLDAANGNIAGLTNTVNSLQGRLQSPAVTFHKFGTGEYDRTWFRPRHDPRWGPSPQQRAQQLCGSARAFLYVAGDRAGGCCGYTDYVVACLSQ